MAYNDYGVLIKKNKQIILDHDDCIRISNVNVRFYYKNIIIGDNEDYHDDLWFHDLESYTGKCPYKKYRMKKDVNGVKIDSKRIDDGDKYYTVIIHEGDMYEIIHGYGIDIDFNLVYNKNSKLMNKLNRFVGGVRLDSAKPDFFKHDIIDLMR